MWEWNNLDWRCIFLKDEKKFNLEGTEGLNTTEKIYAIKLKVLVEENKEEINLWYRVKGFTRGHLI